MINKLSNKPVIFYLFSFFLPFFITLLALNALHITPFGDHTLVISDANGLYINYLSYAGRFFKGLEGFTYSFKKGLGGNMMPHMAGTMINPFFPIITLFNIADYPTAFTWISVLNFCACGLTMYAFIADMSGHKRSNLIFSTSYALSGFLVANVFQVIFFTGPLMLPLMVLGLRRIFQGKRPIVYFLSLTFCILTNIYFGFTLCIASALFFFVYLWMKKDELRGKRLAIFLHYGISSLCAGLIPVIVWLPTLRGISGGRLDQTKLSDFSFCEKMPFVEIFSKLFTGANTTSQLVNGLPNIFVGLLPVALVILFFINKKISHRMKIAAGITLAVYLVGFYIIFFDMLFHAGTTTNWFNFRYSYIFSFLLLMIACYEWQYVDELSCDILKKVFLGMVIAALIIFSKHYEYVMGSEVLLDFILLMVIYLAYRLYRLKPESNPKRTFELVVTVIVSFSLFLNYTICTKNIMEWGIEKSDYQETVNSVSPLITGIQNADDDFYRMEVNNQRSGTLGNDPMLYGYNGVGHGGSNERNFVREETSKLGVQWYNMRNYYAQGIPAATDTLLGIRYLIADEDVTEEKNYIRMTDMEAMGLATSDEVYDAYKNDYALPIAFVAEKDVNALELDYDDLFDNLNQVWSAISGAADRVFVEENDIEFRSLNLSESQKMSAEDAREIVQSYENKESESDSSFESDRKTAEEELTVSLVQNEAPMLASSIEFSFVAKQDGPVYIYHGAALNKSNGSTESVVRYLGYYHKGDTVTGYLPVTSDYVNKVTFEEYAGRFRAAYADLEALQKMSEEVTSRPSTIEKIKDSHLKGNVTVEEGQELLFTIPWDEGWTCYIDGQKKELTKVLGVFMAAEVEPGEHTYEMLYIPGGMETGMKISAAAAVLMLLYLLFGRKLIDKMLVHRSVATTIES